VLPNHYEEHIDPPRKINICRSCHTPIHTRLGKKRSGKYPRNIRKVNARKQPGKKTRYHIVLPKQWVEQHCPNLELYRIIVGNTVIGVPSDREDLLRDVVSLLPRLMDIGNSNNTTVTNEDIHKILELNPEIREYVMDEIESEQEAEPIV